MNDILLGNMAWGLLMMLGIWMLSLRLKDASIIDICWGLGFVLIAWRTALLSEGYDPRRFLLLALTTAWGLRLSVHLFLRKAGQGEDARYADMRRKREQTFWWWSLFGVFMLQALIMWIISLPVQVGQISSNPAHMTLWDRLGFGIWLVGFLLEAVSDAQLARFKADPANKGRVMRSGLWAWSRHPNYFGESLIWWGIFLIAFSTPGSAWTIISPILITFLLLKVSGVTLLDRAMLEKRPEYRDYMETTSAFFPRPPRRRRP